eukprot:2701977-Prorocentrum_lima.AAC.1
MFRYSPAQLIPSPLWSAALHYLGIHTEANASFTSEGIGGDSQPESPHCRESTSSTCSSDEGSIHYLS